MLLRTAVLLLLTFSFLNSTCDPASILGPQADNADRYTKRVTYHRGSCFGRCEVYTLNVYENGLLTFAGERFTDKPGYWEANIDRRRVVSLLDSFERADFASYPRVFISDIPDAPSVTMTYTNEAGNTYTTSFKENYPDELEGLDRALVRLAHGTNFRQVSATIPENVTNTPATVQPVANNTRQELIVHLKPDVNAKAWVIAYAKQNVTVKERISPNGNYYLLESDPNIMGAEELLGFLRQDESVISAQLNQAVTPR